MNKKEVISEFLKLLPKHECSFQISHNNNRTYYQSVKEYLEEDDNLQDPFHVFKDAEDKQKCIVNNELWTAQWYPDTPVGFYVMSASSLEVLIDCLEEYL